MRCENSKDNLSIVLDLNQNCTDNNTLRHLFESKGNSGFVHNIFNYKTVCNEFLLDLCCKFLDREMKRVEKDVGCCDNKVWLCSGIFISDYMFVDSDWLGIFIRYKRFVNFKSLNKKQATTSLKKQIFDKITIVLSYVIVFSFKNYVFCIETKKNSDMNSKKGIRKPRYIYYIKMNEKLIGLENLKKLRTGYNSKNKTRKHENKESIKNGQRKTKKTKIRTGLFGIMHKNELKENSTINNEQGLKTMYKSSAKEDKKTRTGLFGIIHKNELKEDSTISNEQGLKTIYKSYINIFKKTRTGLFDIIHKNELKGKSTISNEQGLKTIYKSYINIFKKTRTGLFDIMLKNELRANNTINNEQGLKTIYKSSINIFKKTRTRLFDIINKNELKASSTISNEQTLKTIYKSYTNIFKKTNSKSISISITNQPIFRKHLHILITYIIYLSSYISFINCTQSAASNQADYNVTRNHDDHAPTNHSDVRSNAVHGFYPGEGHEAIRGGGINLHAHEQAYGPAHELHGEFNDGHTRMEHQMMYHKGGPGHGGSHSGMGSGQLHDNAMWDAYGHGWGGGVWNDGFGGEDHGGHSPDGWLYGEGQGAAMGGVHGNGYFFGHGGTHGLGHGWGVGDIGHGYGSGHGWGAGHLAAAEGFAHGRDMFGHGYGGLYGGGLEHNDALLGAGLLSATGDEIAFGGAMHGLAAGFGRAGLASDFGVGANVMNFYHDEGLVDPVTGTFRGGSAHGHTFGHHARQHAKGLEIARNMANGNVFRHAVAVEGDEGALSDAAFGHQHSHYGQSGILPTMAHRHSAMLGAVEGHTTMFHGEDLHNAAVAQHIALEKQALAGDIEAMQHIVNFQNMTAEGKASLKDRQGFAYARNAQLDALVGNYGSAHEKLKKSVMSHIEAAKERNDQMANWNMQAAHESMLHGDMIAAAGFEAAGQCMAAKGVQTAAAYAMSIGAQNHHFDQTSFIGSEEHAAIARKKALVAEEMRAHALSMDSSFSNAITAAAAVQDAEGRAEGEFGKKLDKISQDKQVQASMVSLDDVSASGIKEAVATQDNLRMIETGNSTLSKVVTDTLDDMALKNRGVAHRKANQEAGMVLADVTAANMLNAMAVNDILTVELKPPPIKEAMFVANAEEIAGKLIEKEAKKIKKEQEEEKARIQREKQKKENSRNALGIIETIPEEAERIEIANSILRLPLKPYEPKVARTLVEKEALEAQNRLRDDLRGKITSRKFDSVLNVIKTEKGFFNIPESGQRIEIKEGLAYFGEGAKAKMIKNGISTEFLSHKINTGERVDMAAGMGYYVADMGGMFIDFPSPLSPHPPNLAYSRSKVIELGEAEGVDIALGTVVLIPWSEYLRKLRPRVNLAIIKEFPSKEAIKKAKKINKVIDQAENIMKKDMEMVEEISNVQKKIIVNPDGKTYVELKPAYGVAEQVRLEDTDKIIESKYVRDRPDMKFGQNGVEEITGESEVKKYIGSGRSAKMGDEEQMRVVLDQETRFLINTRNAFTNEVVAEKENWVNNVNIPVFGGVDWQRVVDGETGESLMKISEEGKTAFERAERVNKIKINIQKSKDLKKEFHFEEGMGRSKKWEFEIRIERVIGSQGSIKLKSDSDLVKIIEWYTHVKFLDLREFQFELGFNTFRQNQHEFLRRFRQNGLQWLEWINRIKKDLKQNLIKQAETEFIRLNPRKINMDESSKISSMDMKIIKSARDKIPNQNTINDMVDKISTETFNRIRDFFILSFRAPDHIKALVSRQKNAADVEIKSIFGNIADIVMEMINNKLSIIENRDTTLGGTITGNTQRIFLPIRNTTEIRIPLKNNKYLRKEINVSLMRPFDIEMKKRIRINDKNGNKKNEVIFADMPNESEIGKIQQNEIPVSSITRVSVEEKDNPPVKGILLNHGYATVHKRDFDFTGSKQHENKGTIVFNNKIPEFKNIGNNADSILFGKNANCLLNNNIGQNFEKNLKSPIVVNLPVLNQNTTYKPSDNGSFTAISSNVNSQNPPKINGSFTAVSSNINPQNLSTSNKTFPTIASKKPLLNISNIRVKNKSEACIPTDKNITRIPVKVRSSR